MNRIWRIWRTKCKECNHLKFNHRKYRPFGCYLCLCIGFEKRLHIEVVGVEL